MNTRLNPYLNLNGNAREALEYYRTVFGGTVEMTTFAEGGMPHDPAIADKLMHGMIEVPNGITFMISDVQYTENYQAPHGVSLTISGDNETEIKGYWEKLADGATVTAPFDKAPWGDWFGMLTDKFGIDWMVNITPAK